MLQTVHWVSFGMSLLWMSCFWGIFEHKIPPILLKSCKVIIITEMDVLVSIHLSLQSSGEDFFAMNNNKKMSRWAKDLGSMIEYRIQQSETVKTEKACWKRTSLFQCLMEWLLQALYLNFFLFPACLPFSVCYKPFCAQYSLSLFSPLKVFFVQCGINLPSYYL